MVLMRGLSERKMPIGKEGRKEGGEEEQETHRTDQNGMKSHGGKCTFIHRRILWHRNICVSSAGAAVAALTAVCFGAPTSKE